MHERKGNASLHFLLTVLTKKVYLKCMANTQCKLFHGIVVLYNLQLMYQDQETHEVIHLCCWLPSRSYLICPHDGSQRTVYNCLFPTGLLNQIYYQVSTFLCGSAFMAHWHSASSTASCLRESVTNFLSSLLHPVFTDDWTSIRHVLLGQEILFLN